jgi:hypothetical protein
MSARPAPTPWFNPRASVQVVNFDDQRFCLVIDDALLEPERLVQFAAVGRAAFQPVDFSAYPGIYLMPPEEAIIGLSEVFLQQVRRRYDARRCEDAHVRLSLVTLPPEALRPRQWFCHVDNALVDARHSMQASVLYLFKDQTLGGTNFYAPTRPPAEISALWQAADSLAAAEFTQRYGISAGYMNESNDFFRRIGSVEAKWNRLIFYDGGMFHATAIASPEKLSADPLTGRLTLNGFFTCRRNLA